MPNLWSQYTQKIYETLYGPRTKDTEFDIKVEEIKACERTPWSGLLRILAVLEYRRRDYSGASGHREVI